MTFQLPAVNEETDLVDFVENGRTHKLHPDALRAWRAMKGKAGEAGIELRLISAFRSIERQREIVERKRADGLSDEAIFSVNARPGYSEHHSGRAVDLGTEGTKPLDQSFELTPAYTWLTRHALAFQFHLSYPPENPYGIISEPWHWCYKLNTELVEP